MRYDLHLHTHYSKCSNMAPALLLKIANKLKLDGIAVVDHNTMKGSIKVKELNNNRDIEVILGSEIKTNYGDILVYYQQEEIKERRLLDVIDSVREQDALISIAHPFRPLPLTNFRYSIKKISKKINAIEFFNGRNTSYANNKAQAVGKRYGLAGTGGSDGHFWFEVGKVITKFEGSLRKAIRHRLTEIEGRNYFAVPGMIASGILQLFANRSS